MRTFDFDDISIAPRRASTVLHRADASCAVQIGPLSLALPLVASPMPDVSGPEMCARLSSGGAMGILHRFQPIAEQVKGYAVAPGCGAAVGISGDYEERFSALAQAGCRVFCLDTANGAHIQVAHAMDWMRKELPEATLMAGNVATAEAFRWLEDHGADAIRVGIAGGSVCETKTETGVFVPTPYAVWEAASVRQRALIIGDSGVRTPADACKLIALGADLVMVGSVFAGTKESPGRVIMVEGKKFKIMRGAASFSVQQEVRGIKPAYVEGAETLVSYKGSVAGVLERFHAGLLSSMSYLDARTLDEYRAHASFVRLS